MATWDRDKARRDRDIAFFGSRLGLAGRSIILSNESAEEYQELVDRFLAQYRPEGTIESFQIDQMIAAEWRLRRIRKIEAAFERRAREQNEEADEPVELSSILEELDSPRVMAFLERYKAGLLHSYHSSRKLLLQLQNERKSAAAMTSKGAGKRSHG
jgi:hypothetical protein